VQLEGTDCTLPGQTVGLINREKSPALPGMDQPVQPGKNNNEFDHLGKTSSKLNLIAFPEKNF
jgi:hypothetical protein